MRNNSQGRQQMFEMIEQWQQSGLSQNLFCRQQGIKYHTFHYWYKGYRQNTAQDNSASFVKLQIKKPTVAGTVEIYFPGGIHVLFHGAVTSSYLKTLIS